MGLIILNSSVFADDRPYYARDYEREYVRNMVTNCFNEAFELNDYILYFFQGVLCNNSFSLDEHDSDNRLHSIHIIIYFNSGAYDLNDYLSNVIENKIFFELTNIFYGIEINISIYYPFCIILQNRFYGHNYGVVELKSIIDIANDGYKVIIENINSTEFINGYFMGNYISTDIDRLNRIKQNIPNKFNGFLEILYSFFEKKKLLFLDKFGHTAHNRTVYVRRLSAARLRKTAVGLCPLCGFLSATVWAGGNAAHCPITCPNRHIQPGRYVKWLDLIE
jgi:hypothetical protein